MFKALAKAILKPVIEVWLKTRALHVSEKDAPKIAKQFGVTVEGLRSLEVFYADMAVGRIDSL